MTKHHLEIRRLPQKLTCDPSRSITRFFWPGSCERACRIQSRVMNLSDSQAEQLLQEIMTDFECHHLDLEETLQENYEEFARRCEPKDSPSQCRKLLIGAYFTMEYSFESTALFNPSMVPAYDQSNLPEGWTRFVMSLRAVGEGHISSIVFRRGMLDTDCQVHFSPVCTQPLRAKTSPNQQYDKQTYFVKLIEMGGYAPLADDVLDMLDARFTLHQLQTAIERIRPKAENEQNYETLARNMQWLAQANYEIEMGDPSRVSDMVLFPISEAESQGMEDMRLVAFTNDNGTRAFYGTYTAFNGHQILPQILECSQPGTARIHTMSGRYATNKGMALFPRKIDGMYAMLGRIDGENLFILRSDNIRFWNEAEKLEEPRYTWEFVQIGNCGSPIETEAGWLVLTHGVGPMRRYCMGAMLLDRDNPIRIVGQLQSPLLTPSPEERIGYVPNVVYSCGGMIHNGLLVIPYGISDVATGFATVELNALLEELT